MKTDNSVLPGCTSILIVNLGGIGDLLLSSGALASLKKAYPDARIDFLVVPRAAAFVRTYAFAGHVYSYPGAAHPAALLALVRALRGERYDIVLNMRTLVSTVSALKMHALLRLCGAPTIAGRNTDGRGNFFDISIPEHFGYPFNDSEPEYYYDVQLVERLGAPVTEDINIVLSPGDTALAERFFNERGMTADDFVIGINPGGQQSRRWPMENFAGLIRHLAAAFRCKFILTGSMNERELCDRIVRQAGGAAIFDLSGQTTVNQLAALIKKCHIYVSNDTGAMHLCTAVNTPGVYLFGGGHRRRYRPFRNPERYTLLQHPVSCAPCEIMKCGRLTCMRSITVEETAAAVMDLKWRVYAR